MTTPTPAPAPMTAGKLPIKAAAAVASAYDLEQVLLIGWDGKQVHVVTYGTTPENCKAAAKAQDFWLGRIREFSFRDEPDRIALTARVSRLLEAVEGAEKALEYYAANCADMPPWRVTDAAGGLIADWEGFTERARSALATLRAAREGAR